MYIYIYLLQQWFVFLHWKDTHSPKYALVGVLLWDIILTYNFIKVAYNDRI